MCKCTPNLRTPFCGKPGCEWPAQSKHENCSDILRNLREIVADTDEDPYDYDYLLRVLDTAADEIERLTRDIAHRNELEKFAAPFSCATHGLVPNIAWFNGGCPCCDVDHLRAKLAAQPQWQPIETAPKDGTPFLCGFFDHTKSNYFWVTKAHWANGAVDGGWDGAGEPIELVKTGYWMPLPCAPKEES